MTLHASRSDQFPHLLKAYLYIDASMEGQLCKKYNPFVPENGAPVALIGNSTYPFFASLIVLKSIFVMHDQLPNLNTRCANNQMLIIDYEYMLEWVGSKHLGKFAEHFPSCVWENKWPGYVCADRICFCCVSCNSHHPSNQLSLLTPHRYFPIQIKCWDGPRMWLGHELNCESQIW